MAHQLTQIPDTDNIEVAKIAAALFLMGQVGGGIETNLNDFAKVYRVVCEAISNEGNINVSKILKAIRESNE